MNLVFITLVAQVDYSGDLPPVETQSPTQATAISAAIAFGFIVVEDAVLGDAHTTEKGKVYCEALRAVKEPVSTWVMPE